MRAWTVLLLCLLAVGGVYAATSADYDAWIDRSLDAQMPYTHFTPAPGTFQDGFENLSKWSTDPNNPSTITQQRDIDAAREGSHFLNWTYNVTDAATYIQYNFTTPRNFTNMTGIPIYVHTSAGLNITLRPAFYVAETPGDEFLNFSNASRLYYNSTNTTTATDFSGLSNHGTMTAITGSSYFRKDGSAHASWNFNGVSSQIVTGSPTLMASAGGSQPYAICMWFRPEPSSSNMGLMVSTNNNFRLYLDTQGEMNLFAQNASSSIITNAGGRYLATFDSWNHGCVNFNGTTYRLYMNGAGYPITDLRTAYDANYTLEIGGASGSVAYFNGSMDDIRLFNRTLSGAEIAYLYKQGVAEYLPSITAPLNFTGGKYLYFDFHGIANVYFSQGQLANVSAIRFIIDKNVNNGTGSILLDDVQLVDYYKGNVRQVGTGYWNMNNYTSSLWRSTEVVGVYARQYYDSDSRYYRNNTIRGILRDLMFMQHNTIIPVYRWLGNQVNADSSNFIVPGGVGSSYLLAYRRLFIESNETINQLDDGLVTYYNFDENTVKAFDRTTNRNNGTLRNVTFTTNGKINNAYNFNGVNATITSDNPNIMSLNNGSYSICAWIRPYSNTSNLGIVTSTDNNYRFYLGAQGALAIFAQNASTGTITNTATPNGLILLNQSNHACVTFNGTAYAFYANGVRNVSFDLRTRYDRNYTAIVGGIVGSTTRFNGTVDEVRIYNRSLSISEVHELYNTRLNYNLSETVDEIRTYFQNKNVPAMSETVYVSNQYIMGGMTLAILNNITGNATSSTFNTYLGNITANQNIFGVLPEKASNAVDPSRNILFDAGYTTDSLAMLCNIYNESRDSLALQAINRTNDMLPNIVNQNGELEGFNSSRGQDDHAISNSLFFSTCYRIAVQHNFTALQKAIYLSYNASEITQSNYTSYPWFHLAIYTANDFVEPTDNGYKFPAMHNSSYYKLVNISNVTQSVSVNQSSIIRDYDEWPIMLAAIDNTSAYWILGDNVITNSTDWVFNDTDVQFRLPLTFNVTYNGSSRQVQLLHQNGSVFKNTTRQENNVTATLAANVITITSNFSKSVLAQFNSLSTGGIAPATPRFAFPNGSSEYLAYSFANGSLSLAVSALPPGISSLTLDSGLPNITITGPENATSDKDGELTFTYNVSGNLSNCSLLYANGTIIQTASNVSTSIENSFAASGVFADHPLALNPLRWMVSCTSTAGNAVNSSVWDLVTYTGPVQGGGSGDGSGTGSPSSPSTPEVADSARTYSVTITSADKTVGPGESLQATIVLNMTGKAPAQVGVLVYTIRSTDGNTYPPGSMELLEGSHTKTITYPVPEEVPPGPYDLVVTWTAKGLPAVNDVQAITIASPRGIPVWAWVSIGVVGAGIVIWLLIMLAMALGGLFK